MRPFQTATGREVWTEELPGFGNANPMTYAVGGKQYVAVAANDALVAYALP